MVVADTDGFDVDGRRWISGVRAEFSHCAVHLYAVLTLQLQILLMQLTGLKQLVSGKVAVHCTKAL